jgi:hypothetical protein
MGVAQLVRREPAANARVGGQTAELHKDPRARPGQPARRAIDDAEQRPNRQLNPRGEPRLQLVPAPRVHADLAASTALAVTHQQRPPPRVQVAFGQRERLLDAKAAAPEHHDQRAQPPAMSVVGRLAHHGRRSPPRSVGRRDRAVPCCGAAGRRGSPAASRVSDVARPSRMQQARSWDPPPNRTADRAAAYERSRVLQRHHSRDRSAATSTRSGRRLLARQTPEPRPLRASYARVSSRPLAGKRAFSPECSLRGRSYGAFVVSASGRIRPRRCACVSRARRAARACRVPAARRAG